MVLSPFFRLLMRRILAVFNESNRENEPNAWLVCGNESGGHIDDSSFHAMIASKCFRNLKWPIKTPGN